MPLRVTGNAACRVQHVHFVITGGENGAHTARGGREDNDVIPARVFERACTVDITARDESTMKQFSLEFAFKYQPHTHKKLLLPPEDMSVAVCPTCKKLICIYLVFHANVWIECVKIR